MYHTVTKKSLKRSSCRDYHGISDYAEYELRKYACYTWGINVLTLISKGMFVGWGILSPLSKWYGWAPGPVGDMSDGARGWILWVALGIMCADSVVSLLPVALEYLQEALRPLHGGLSSSRDTSIQNKKQEVETEDRLVPLNWVITGLVLSITIGTVLVWFVFGNEGIKPWATLLGFILGGMLSIIGYVIEFSPVFLYHIQLQLESVPLVKPISILCRVWVRYHNSFLHGSSPGILSQILLLAE